MKKTLIISLAVIVLLSAGTFVLFSLGKDNEKEPKPTEITLTQTEIDHYKDIIDGAVGIGRYFTDTTLLELGFSEWYDDPIEDQEAYKRFEESIGIDYNDNRYYPVDPGEPYQTFGELKAAISQWFSADAVEWLLDRELYLEHDGKLYVSPRGKGSNLDYCRVMISEDATVSKQGSKTLSVAVPQEEFVENPEIYETKVVFVTEDGTDKIDKMNLYGCPIGGYVID